METKHDLQTLIARKLEGTITPQELAALDAMVSTSREAAQEVEMLEKIWKTSGYLSISKGMQQEARWQNLQSKIAGEIPAARSAKMIWLRYAAAAAVFVALVTAYFITRDDWVTISTSTNETLAITLPDSSTVKLSSNANLSYNASDWNSNRNLRLKGEAFFEVRRNGISFTIESSNARVAVLGTSFNVNSSLQQTVVTCFSGKVSVANKVSEQKVILTRGLETVVNGDAVSEPYRAAADPFVQGLNFNHVPLWKVFEALANHHGKRIVVPDDIDSVAFTGNLEGSSLESALKTVCLSAGLQFSIMADSAVIR